MTVAPGPPPVPARAQLTRPRADATRAVLLWTFGAPRMALSSAPVGGGTASLDWLVNIGVTDDYDRTDLDAHARDVAQRLGCEGTGAALFTAVDVSEVVRAEDEGITVDATVGVSRPTWAADADGAHRRRDGDRWVPGTVNLVVQVPVTLSPAAAVNAVITVTEAKVQALTGAGVPGTGTASDAIVVCWPAGPPAEPFAGPRSTWGARIARAVHAAVGRGLPTEVPSR